MQALHGEVPKGVLYNILRRPGERRKKDESMADFSSRIEGNILKDEDHFFERIRITFSPQEIEEHIARTMVLVEKFYGWWKETIANKDSRCLDWNSGECNSKYGVCSMLQACANKDFSIYSRRSPIVAEGISHVE
jgi:hypothetical protein